MSAIKNGFYKVDFHAALPGAGGIVAIDGNKVLGGDDQFLYSGTVYGDVSQVAVKLTVAPISSSSISVFGSVGSKYVLDLVGSMTGSSLQLSGLAPAGGTAIKINATWIAELNL